MTVIPALERLRQKDLKFDTSLDCIVILCFTKKVGGRGYFRQKYILKS
jgi:hypothetical protein